MYAMVTGEIHTQLNSSTALGSWESSGKLGIWESLTVGDGETIEPCRRLLIGNDISFQDAVKNAMKKLDEFVNRSSKGVGLEEKSSEIGGVNGEEWDWERWKKHLTEVEEE
ncbi:hypothetical protein BC332_31977 [Capsicum chinense]|nr:hypothetical protein BC332_31977 [Capsicum chinense]